MPWSSYFECWALSQLFHSLLSLSSRGSLAPIHFLPFRVVLSAYLRLSTFLSAISIPACASSSPAFCMMYSAYKLNKQGDNMQPWWTPFPIWNLSFVPCQILTVSSWPVYRLLRMQVRWPGIPISLRIFRFVVLHTVRGFSIVNEAEVDVFLELSCFFYDPTERSNCWQFDHLEAWTSGSLSSHTVEAILENFEHYFASVWNEYNCAIVLTVFGIAFLWDWNESYPE